MTREEKISAIYKEMANKEKTMGCKYLVYAKNKPDEVIEAIEEGKNFTLFFGENDYAMYPSEVDYYEYYSIKEVIGHPVMIGDVLNWIDNKKFNVDDPMIGLFYDPKKMDYETKLFLVQDYLFGRVNGYWRKKRKPIEEQSDECIDFVHSLIKKS